MPAQPIPRNVPPKVGSARGRVAALVQTGADPERIEAARRELRAAKLEDHIRKEVDGWPPLTEAQRGQLGLLLRPGGDHAT